ncbi:hypothetical protein [Corynebacterium renale]|uniref:hypothetical protein n=1 Tax=Corynebacterium renale TaxID=1724 RepID=UPI0011AB4EE9|nr:hypothetical protein [Corynebacterium renale]
MRKQTVVTALVTSLSLLGASLVAPNAVAQEKTTTAVVGAESKIDVVTSPERMFSYYYSHPLSMAKVAGNYIRPAAFVAGKGIETGTDTMKIVDAPRPGVTRYESAEKLSDGTEYVRRADVTNNSIEFEHEIRNNSGSTIQAQLDLTNVFDESLHMVGKTTDKGYELRSQTPGYTALVNFTNPDTSGYSAEWGTKLQEGNTAEETPATYQGGRWLTLLEPGETLKGGVTVELKSETGALDSDGDGIPDVWEREGFTTASGESMPLHRWGADPDRPDVFLQLNWMKSEWETLGCNRVNDYGVNVSEFAEFAQCDTANTNVYRPTRNSLIDLVKKFDEHGVNLWIDAGDFYTNMRGYTDRKGGPTEDFEPYYFADRPAGEKLSDNVDKLLGDRKAVFRVGVIGDAQAEGNRSSGLALMKHGSLYVAKHSGMTNAEQVRNTIMHELGHNLNLTHAGAKSLNPPKSDYVPNYKSVMNYLYQFSYFNYSTETARPGGPLPQECSINGNDCYAGDYTIAPDWENIDLRGNHMAGVLGSVGTNDQHQETVTTEDLVVNAAVENNGKAGFYLEDGSGITTHRTDNELVGKVHNLGYDLHTFSVEATYENGRSAKVDRITIAGAPDRENSKATVHIPVPDAQSLTGPKTSVKFTVRNRQGEVVEEQFLDVSVLDYTKEEASKVLEEVRKSDASPEVKKLAEKKLPPAAPQPAPETSTPTPVVPKPIPTRTVEPTVKAPEKITPTTTKKAEPAPQDTKSSFNSGTIAGIIGILLALGGLGAAIVGSMKDLSRFLP